MLMHEAQILQPRIYFNFAAQTLLRFRSTYQVAADTRSSEPTRNNHEASRHLV